jgi:hypothetical protein
MVKNTLNNKFQIERLALAIARQNFGNVSDSEALKDAKTNSTNVSFDAKMPMLQNQVTIRRSTATGTRYLSTGRLKARLARHLKLLKTPTFTFANSAKQYTLVSQGLWKLRVAVIWNHN